MTSNDRANGPRSGSSQPERIAKRMFRAGLCSRRDAERWIEEGRVKLDGEILTSPAVTVTDQSDIEVDGVPLPAIGQPRLFRFHKPKGYLTAARDPEGRKTIADLIPAELPRLMPIGRLDMNSEGLLLLTTDGALKRQLELPSTGWQRRYRVRVHGDIDEDKLAKLRDGITIDGFDYGPIEASLERAVGKNAWLSIALREGKNREIRRVMEHFGWPVNRLIRVSFGPFHLGKLPKADIDEIKTKVVKEQIGLVLQSTTDTSQRKRRLASSEKKKKPAPDNRKATPSRDEQRSAKPLNAKHQRRQSPKTTFESKDGGSDKTAEKTPQGNGRSAGTPSRTRVRQKPVGGARSRPAR